MIPNVDYESDGHVYKLRGIRASDMLALADSLRGWPQLDGEYNPSHALRDCWQWGNENDAFAGLPTKDFEPLTWALVYDGATIGFCRMVYLGTQSHVHFQAIHPDYRGGGHFTVMNLMLRTLIEPMGVEKITFESLPDVPQVDTHAADRLELAPTETKTGMTGKEVTSYEFTKEQQAERLKDPKHTAESIDVKIEAVPVRDAKEETPIELDVKPRS